jgi:hypothetical protein
MLVIPTARAVLSTSVSPTSFASRTVAVFTDSSIVFRIVIFPYVFLEIRWTHSSGVKD